MNTVYELHWLSVPGIFMVRHVMVNTVYELHWLSMHEVFHYCSKGFLIVLQIFVFKDSFCFCCRV